MKAELLHVVAVISNPIRFQSRYRLYRQFEKHMKDSGVNLVTVEVQQGDRPFEVTEACNPNHLQMRTFDELWIKENMINLGIARLPSNWEYVAWVDADVMFTRPDWAAETVHQLQHYMVVQMFESCVDLGPSEEPLQIHKSFMSEYIKNGCRHPVGPGHYGSYSPVKNFWHPGFAWAARREAIDAIGGVIDFAILGSGDHHMATALIGCVQRSVPHWIGEKYQNELLIWQERCEQYIKRDVGFVSGTIMHKWHGKKKDRKYVARWQILKDHNYDPDDDLKRDWQGLLQLEVLTPRQRKLRDDIRAYFRNRSEDSIDL